MKLAWIRAARVGTRLFLSAFEGALFQSVRRRSSRTAIRRILVHRIGNFGDILVTLPTLSAICDRDLICLKGIEADDVLSAVERQFTRRDLRVAVEEK